MCGTAVTADALPRAWALAVIADATKSVIASTLFIVVSFRLDIGLPRGLYEAVGPARVGWERQVQPGREPAVNCVCWLFRAFEFDEAPPALDLAVKASARLSLAFGRLGMSPAQPVDVIGREIRPALLEFSPFLRAQCALGELAIH